ncbi:MAG: efflux RND transporter permease subunit [Betaproteobacteria bacterium]|nr:MAG: efflux RND transporter permease subunit [Betaproteobacteria bacterium]
MKFVELLLRNHPFANITFGVVLLMGAIGYALLPREQDPEINFNWVNITTVLPGASAEDIEKRVTQPLEDAIRQVADIRFVVSSSRENTSSILVRFRDITERVFDKRVNDLRREIQNKAQTELPPEVRNDPRVMEITTSNGFPTAQVLLAGRADDETLRRTAYAIRADLERLTGVDQVFALGLRDPELLVEFDPRRLAARGLNAAELADAVGAWFRDTFAGKQVAGNEAWLVRLIGQQADPEYLAQLTVAVPGTSQRVPLDTLASASRARATPRNLASAQGRPAVMFSVTKKSYTNTLELVERIRAYAAQHNPLLAASGLSLALTDDQTVPTREAINVMQSNAALGLALVLAVCWIFLGTRVSILIALGIPFSLAGAFAVLYATGFTLNISVLLGVVIVLGMIVDDAVVVVEALYWRVQRGQEVLGAALDALRETFTPVTSSVATTIAAFLPLMLLPGIVGKFMFVIPFVVTVTLAISLVEAYWMLPTHVVALRLELSRPTRMQRLRHRFTHLLRLKYSRALLFVMRRPRRFAALIVLTVAAAGAAVASGLVRLEFFAFDPVRIFYVNVDMPAGAPIEATLARVEALEREVRKRLREGEPRALTSIAGVKFTDTEPLYGDAYGQVIVSLAPRTEASRDVGEIVAAMRADLESFPGPGRLSFTLISGGPPVTKPVRVRVRTDDPAELRAATDALLAIVRAMPGTRDVTDDDIAGRPELVLTLDPEAVRAAGLNPGLVARLARLHVDGEIVTQMRDQGEKVEVRVRAAPRDTADVARVLSDPVALRAAAGAADAAAARSTTLGALVRAETRSGKGVIKHYNLRRSLTVEADIDRRLTDTVAVNDAIRAAWEKVRARYPSTTLDFSGELDDIQESLDAMKVLFLLGIGLIYLILAAQFRSYWQPAMILVTVPLAFTGVVFGLLISGNPLSLFTLYGVIALTGIAVNSAIVLIDAANRRRRARMSVLYAVVLAARRRVVPIIITSTTTIAGLLSLAVGLGGHSLLWGPVAASIVWGIGFSTLLTLFAMPLLYWALMPEHRARRGDTSAARLP